MRVKFQADADFNNRVVRAVLRRWPSIDIRGAPGFLPDNLPDPEVLAIAASDGRILLSHDATTMTAHFLRFIETSESPGLILVPQYWPVPLIANGIYALWSRASV